MDDPSKPPESNNCLFIYIRGNHLQNRATNAELHLHVPQKIPASE